ncbi:MAG: RNA pseudouridine synthase [Ignavibacteriales bacterium]|nr:RNA pseudouridine synthase [Ignavibacteriales bacterium]
MPNLYEILRGELGKVYVVHRIDKETSGVIAFAKTAKSHKKLDEEFKCRAVEKIYIAVCEGTIESKEGEIDLPLAESAEGVMYVMKKKGKEANTSYTIVEHFQGYVLVGAIPRTGRTHQIRVHLREIGLPILGDPLYGNGEPFYLSAVKVNYRKEGEEKPLLNRTALHAAKLTFEHPLSGGRVTCEAPLPKDMKTVVNYLRKFRSVGEATAVIPSGF